MGVSGTFEECVPKPSNRTGETPVPHRFQDALRTVVFHRWVDYGVGPMPGTGKMKKARPTIQAIAARAGVSRTTVSLILGNRDDIVQRFKPATVERVREIAAEVGYRANLMALSLRSTRPTFFGLILRGTNMADAISWHHQAFEGQFLAGAMEASRLLGLYPVLATQDSPDAEGALQRVRGVLDGGVFGAILRTPVPGLTEPMQRQIEQGVPVVIVFPEEVTACPTNSIDMDNVAAGRLAGELLAGAGRTRWALVIDKQLWEAVRLRKKGFLAKAREAGAKVDELAMPSRITEHETAQWLTPRLKALRPDGVLAASSVAGVGTLLACQAAGLRVPEDTCLVGCDASLWRAPGCPAITSVDVSWYEAGDLAVRTMVGLREREESAFENVTLPPKARRGGTCPVPGEDGGTAG